MDRRALVGERADFDRDLLDRLERAVGGRQGRECGGDRLFADIEAGIDRVDGDQRRQRRGGRTAGDEVAGGDLHLADTSGHRCAYLCVAEFQLGGVECRLRRLEARLRFGERVLALVDIALRDAVALGEAFAALELRLGEFDAGLSRGILPLGLDHRGLEGLRIDREEQVAGLHQRALAKIDGLDGPGDARADLHAVDGFQAAGKLLPRHDILVLDHRDGDRHGRHFGGCRSFGLGGLAWNLNHEGGAENGREQSQAGAREGPAFALR